METEPSLILSERLEELSIEPATHGLKGLHANHCAEAAPIFVVIGHTAFIAQPNIYMIRVRRQITAGLY